jgi:hypothetical protein
MFPERFTQPMVGSRICGEHIDTGLTGLKADPALPENPVQSENALHSQRYSLTSDYIDQASLIKAKVSTKYTPGAHRCQVTFSGPVRCAWEDYPKRSCVHPSVEEENAHDFGYIQ